MMLIQMQRIIKEFINTRNKWLQQKKRGILCNIRKQLIQTFKILLVQVSKSEDQFMKLFMINILKQ